MQIHNTETGRKEPFVPRSLPVTMYVCGLTPKNEPHLGHALLFVFNDTVRRYLEYRGYPVHYVQNFTDIDDKIIAAGHREGIAPAVAARRYTASYFRDMARLNVRPADEYTYVTRYMPQIIVVIEGLITGGHAYTVGGDVFFSVPSFPPYGRLSGRDNEAMLAGARVEPDERKHDPRDFALWKSAKPGEPWWESPWGRGRPGWHIECSTMAMRALGEQIDIHGGGSDLIFPHHENEIAQSESYSGRVPFVRYWLHTGMLSLPAPSGGEEKMAHSGTFVTINAVLQSGDVPGPALRTYLLGQHYRANPIYSEEQLRASVARWHRWEQTRENAQRLLAWAQAHTASTEQVDAGGAAERRLHDEVARARADFVTAMDDDFNTSRALSVLDELAHRVNEYTHGLGGEAAPRTSVAALQDALAMLEELTAAIGIELTDAAAPREHLDAEVRATIQALVEQRTAARARRDWPEADRLRRVLDEEYGVVLKDTPQGVTWSAHARD